MCGGIYEHASVQDAALQVEEASSRNDDCVKKLNVEKLAIRVMLPVHYLPLFCLANNATRGPPFFLTTLRECS